MYMLSNSSKNPQNYQIDQNTVLCLHTLYSEKPADNLQCHSFQFHNKKKKLTEFGYFVAVCGILLKTFKTLDM